MSRPDNHNIRLAGRQVDAARDLVATCILSPAIDAGADAEPETVEEARTAARVLTRLGWPGPPVAEVLLTEDEVLLIRRAAVAGLGAAVDEVQEGALAAIHAGADLDVQAALEDMERARRVLDGVGWTAAGEHAMPGRGTLGREIEERFADLVHALPALVVVTDADGRPELFSEAALQMAGLSADELRHGGWQRVIDRRDVPRLAAAFRAARDEQRPLQVECRVRRADGEPRRMRVTATPRIERDGTLSGYAGIAEDVTDVRAARASRSARAEASAMSSSRTTALWMCDTTGRCTYMNRGWYDMFGLDPEDRAPDFTARFHPDDRDAAIALASDAIRTRERREGEFRYRAADAGDYRWMRVVAEPRGEDGRFAGLIGTCTDITRGHRAEEKREAILRVTAAAARGATASEVFHLTASEIRALVDLDLVLVVRFDGPEGVIVGTSGDAALVGLHLAPVSGDTPWGAIVGMSASGPQGIEVAAEKLTRMSALLGATLVLCDAHAPIATDLGDLTA